MIYHAAPQLFTKYPGYVRGLVIVRRAINIESPIDEVQRMLLSVQKTIRQRADLETPSTHPNIAAWREAYRAFGAKPTEFPSSIEALVKRVRRGDDVPYINTLAAIGNSASLRYLVPIGGHAIDVMQVDGELRLGFATGSEEFTPFSGGPLEHPVADEVIFTYNTSIVLCRRWTWRQGEFSKLQRTTTAAVINVDGLPPTTRADVDAICNDLATLVGMYCGNAPTEVKMLSEDQLEVEL
ncbi:MAG TPA: phenylalanine--tRNA ligase beta subunit-related protein [Anaerolineae bacterium]|nr:phenylalanine--tRNA ligase beta subunit-related protein [Anaerolineae bacterium]